MAPRTTYPNLSQIKDPALKTALKLIYDKLGVLEGQSGDIGALTQPLASHLDASGNLVRAIADPVLGNDAANLQTVQRIVNVKIREALTRAGILEAPPSQGGPGQGSGGGAGPQPSTTPPGPGPGPGPDPPPQEGTGLVRCGGRAFHLTDGSIWPWRGCTDARLYEFWLTGIDITPIVTQRVTSGANLVRVFGMYAPSSFIGNFDPRAYGNYFTQLGPFADALLALGAFLEFVVFVNAESLYPSNTEKVDHFGAVFSQLSPKTGVFMELANEFSNNGIDPGLFARPTGLLHSRASAIIGDLPYRPCWDYISHHQERGPDWPRSGKELIELRDGFSGWTAVNRPVVGDEPMGAAETPSSNRSNIPDEFYYFAANCQLMGAGASFHSSNGLQSALFQPITQLCANSFFAGLAAIPPVAQLWSYTNFGFGDFPIDSPPDFIKCYGKIDDPGNQAIVVAIRPGGGWAPVARVGWTITGFAGPSNCVVYLHR